MNVQDVVTRVKRSFGDESAVQVTDADIIRWINDAQRDAVIHNDELLEATATVDIVDGTNEYALPTDLLLLRSARFKLPGMLSYEYIPYKSLQTFDKYVAGWDGTFQGESIPYVYTIYGSSLFLFPTPDKSQTDGLKLLYSQLPTEVALVSDELSLPLIYHNSIVMYCMSQANIMDEDYEASAIHETRFRNSMNTLSFQKQQRGTEYYPTITVLPEDR